MYYLNYILKDETGKIVARLFYPSEEEMERIREVMLDPHRSAELSFRGQILKTKNIEILDDRIERQNIERFRYDLNDPQKRAEVRAFEDIILSWMEEGDGRTFEKYLEERQVIRVEREKNKAGIKYQIISILKPIEYADLSAKWSALQELRFRRMKAEQNEQRAVLAGMKEEYPMKSVDEINVAGMF